MIRSSSQFTISRFYPENKEDISKKGGLPPIGLFGGAVVAGGSWMGVVRGRSVQLGSAACANKGHPYN